jgi:hypothetical protein
MPSGNLYPTSTASRAEWSAGTWNLPFCFNQFAYAADSLYGVATPAGAGAAKTRTWTPPVSTAPTRQFYTYERGQAGAVNKHAYAHFNSLSYTVAKRGETGLSGDLAAREQTLVTSLTAAPTTVASMIADATQFNIYTQTTMALLDSSPTLVNEVHSIAFSNGPMLSPAYFIGATNRSFDAVGAIVPNSSVTIVLPYDISGTDFAGLLNLSHKRAGTNVFLRVAVEGPELETGVDALWQHDMCLKVLNVPSQQDIEEPFLGISWTAKIFRDSASGIAHRFKTVSGLVST